MRTSAGVDDRLAGDIEDDVAGLDAALGGRPIGVDGGDDDAFAAGARHLLAGASIQAERGVSLTGAAAPGGAAWRSRGNSPSVGDTVFFSPLRTTSSFTVAPGAMAPIFQARSRHP